MLKAVKISIFLFLTLFYYTHANAQRETDNWIMGLIDMWVIMTDSGPIPYSPPNNVDLFVDFFQSSAYASSVSDKEGNLLLYTNGEEVWNSQLNIVPGGGNMASDLSTCLIVPTPYNQKRYYIFSNYPYGITSIHVKQIDITFNNGSGGATLNQLLGVGLPTTGKFTTHYHSNGKDIWLLTHGWNNNTFRAYLVTEPLPYTNAINTNAVTSNSGLVQQDTAIVDLNNSAAWGMMKFSPGGNYVAMTSTGLDVVEIFDFDRETGLVSNPRTITIDRPFSLEFSSNGTYLYFAQYFNCYNSSGCSTPNQDSLPIYQVDLLAGNDSAINNTLQSVSYPSQINLSSNGYRLQLASNQKIYCTFYETFTPVIKEPNLPGSLCNWNDTGFIFPNGYQGNGPIQNFPDFFRSYLDFNILFDDDCYGSTTMIYTLTNQGFDSIRWEFEDTLAGLSFSIPNQDTLYHSFSAIGEYEITLKRYRHGNLDELRRILRIKAEVDIFFVSDTTICEGAEIAISVSDTICDFAWVNDFSFDTIFSDTVSITEQGHWWPIVTNYEEYCGSIDSIQVFVQPDLLDFGPDNQPYCILNPVLLDATLTGNCTYQWSTGDTTASISATDNGYYMVTVQENYCTVYDTIFIFYDEPLPVSLFDTVALCDSIPIAISAGDFNADFTWSPNGETTADIFVTTPGLYSVTASNGCGDFIDSSVAVYLQQPIVNLGNDTLLCSSDTILLENLSAGIFNPATYQWSTIETTSTILVSIAGYFSLTLSNVCGTDADTMLVETVEPPEVNIGNDTIVCMGENLFLNIPYNTYNTYLWSTGETGTSITVFNTDNYSLSVSNACGTFTDSIFLAVQENTFAFPFDSLLLQEGQTTTIDAGLGYTSYFWSNDSTAQSITVGDTGLYWVEVSDSIGCLGSDTVEVVTIDEIQENSVFNKIRVYPNPVKEELIISGLSIGKYDISLFNSLGQEVSTKTLAQNEGLGRRSIDFSGFPKGIYLLSITWANERRVFKVVRE